MILKYLFLLAPFLFYLLTAYLISRKEGFESGYSVFTGISSIAISILTVGIFLDYITAFNWYENLFWLFQGILLISTAVLYVLLVVIALYCLLFYVPKQLASRFKDKNKLIEFLSTFFGTLLFILGFGGFAFLVVVGWWWFLPDKSNICHRYLDGRYSYKTARNKLSSLNERIGSEFGIVDNCRKYIPYVDPDKLILNKEGFWDSFYSE